MKNVPSIPWAIITFSGDIEKRVHHVHKILTTLGEAWVTVNHKKCRLFSDSVDYLGHMIKLSRLEIDQSRTKYLLHAIPTTTRSDLRSFLCLWNVYSRSQFYGYRRPLQRNNKKRCARNLRTPLRTTHVVQNIFLKRFVPRLFKLSRSLTYPIRLKLKLTPMALDVTCSKHMKT